MQINLNLYAAFTDRLPEKKSGNPLVMDLDDGSTIGILLNKLNIGADEPKIIFRNGVHADLEDRLEEGDRVGIFPPIAGG